MQSVQIIDASLFFPLILRFEVFILSKVFDLIVSSDKLTRVFSPYSHFLPSLLVFVIFIILGVIFMKNGPKNALYGFWPYL